MKKYKVSMTYEIGINEEEWEPCFNSEDRIISFKHKTLGAYTLELSEIMINEVERQTIMVDGEDDVHIHVEEQASLDMRLLDTSIELVDEET